MEVATDLSAAAGTPLPPSRSVSAPPARPLKVRTVLVDEEDSDDSACDEPNMTKVDELSLSYMEGRDHFPAAPCAARRPMQCQLTRTRRSTRLQLANLRVLRRLPVAEERVMPPSVRASASFAAVRSARPPAHALASPPPSPPSDLALTNDPLRWRFQWWSRPVPWFRQNHGGACDVAASVGEQPLVSRDATTATRCNASLDTKSAADHTLVPPSTLVALGRKRAALARQPRAAAVRTQSYSGEAARAMRSLAVMGLCDIGLTARVDEVHTEHAAHWLWHALGAAVTAAAGVAIGCAVRRLLLCGDAPPPVTAGQPYELKLDLPIMKSQVGAGDDGDSMLTARFGPTRMPSVKEYAVRAYCYGEIVGEIPAGSRIYKSAQDALALAIRFPRELPFIFYSTLPGTVACADLSALGDGMTTHGVHCGTYYRRFGHSANPSCEPRWDPRRNEVVICAKHAIDEATELTLDYAFMRQPRDQWAVYDSSTQPPVLILPPAPPPAPPPSNPRPVHKRNPRMTVPPALREAALERQLHLSPPRSPPPQGGKQRAKKKHDLRQPLRPRSAALANSMQCTGETRNQSEHRPIIAMAAPRQVLPELRDQRSTALTTARSEDRAIRHPPGCGFLELPARKSLDFNNTPAGMTPQASRATGQRVRAILAHAPVPAARALMSTILIAWRRVCIGRASRVMMVGLSWVLDATHSGRSRVPSMPRSRRLAAGVACHFPLAPLPSPPRPPRHRLATMATILLAQMIPCLAMWLLFSRRVAMPPSTSARSPAKGSFALSVMRAWLLSVVFLVAAVSMGSGVARRCSRAVKPPPSVTCAPSTLTPCPTSRSAQRCHRGSRSDLLGQAAMVATVWAGVGTSMHVCSCGCECVGATRKRDDTLACLVARIMCPECGWGCRRGCHGSAWMLCYMRIIALSGAFVFWLVFKEYPRYSKAFVATVRGRAYTTVYVDSMALRFISANRNAIVRVTDDNPSAFIETVSGSIPVSMIVHAGINVQDRHGRWHYLEIPDAYIDNPSANSSLNR